MTQHPIVDIFGEALDLPVGARAPYLHGACGGNARLRAEVESLLAAYQDAGADVTAPVPDPALDQRDALSECPGTVIGRYRLLQQIGEGGFGVVFTAEQRDPVMRKVALKIIKPGMDTRQVIARFEAERQALALMDHPNIARVLDAGATDSGRPYFVMQLVCGDPITTYCDRQKLSIRERLSLFRQTCDAVQHAHQKGIIHRDLKPSNILVTEVDGCAAPKIIDFGIAKATGGRLTQRTLLTELRQFMGTPEYMSPEQATTGGGDIDTRSDIYSLGVVLYELLTGTTPFEAATLREAGFAELQRIIREEDPPRPSVRLSTLASRSTGGSGVRTGAAPAPGAVDAASRRRADPRHLGRLMRGDLDWVVMKCLEKDRSRRYETASALALDIARYLAEEPVTAAPPGRVYRARKFVARNRGAVSAALAIAAVLVLGMIGTGGGLLRARESALEARQRAQRLAEMVQFLEAQLADMDVVLLHTGSDDARRRALPHLRQAVQERERVLGVKDRATLSSMVLLAEGLLKQREWREAQQCLDRAILASEGVLAQDDPAVISMHSLRGVALQRLGRLSEAEMSGARAVANARVRYTGHASMAGTLSEVLVRYGDTLRALKRLAEAETVFLEADASRCEHALGARPRPGKPAQRLVALYEEWHAAEAGAGHDAKAAEWRERCRAVRAAHDLAPDADGR